MRFKEFLVESEHDQWKPTKLDDKQIIEWCEKNASGFFGQDRPIFRGTRSGFSGLLNTLNLKRAPQSVNGYYQWWLDNHPAWSAFPKRHASIIAITDSVTPENYGETYLIIPADSAKIGICPADDLWRSFEYSNAYDFTINDFMRAINNVLVDGPASNWHELKKCLEKTTIGNVSKNRSKMGLKDLERELVIDMDMSDSENLYSFFEKILDPNHNKFTHSTGAIFSAGMEQEVWISGDVMQLEIEHMSDELKNKLAEMASYDFLLEW